MKNLKKNIFGIGLGFSVMLGVAFSVIPEDASANISKDENNSVSTCWVTAQFSIGWHFVECNSCDMMEGKPTGQAFTCS